MTREEVLNQILQDAHKLAEEVKRGGYVSGIHKQRIQIRTQLEGRRA